MSYRRILLRTVVVVSLVVTAIFGFLVGRLTGDLPAITATFNKTARVTTMPTLPLPPKDDVVPANGGFIPETAVVVEAPAEGSSLEATFEVAGRTQGSVSAVTMLIKGSDGAVLAEATTKPIVAAGANYGRFSQTFALPVTTTGAATVEIGYQESGSDKMADIRNVIFISASSLAVKVFFAKDAVGVDCGAVSPVTRLISTKDSVYRGALLELLKGPTPAETADGFQTLIPDSAELKSVAVNGDGEVLADFSSALGAGAAGSCRVAAIRAQIEMTLKQFPETRAIRLSINGRSTDILQP